MERFQETGTVRQGLVCEFKSGEDLVDILFKSIGVLIGVVWEEQKSNYFAVSCFVDVV